MINNFNITRYSLEIEENSNLQFECSKYITWFSNSCNFYWVYTSSPPAKISNYFLFFQFDMCSPTAFDRWNQHRPQIKDIKGYICVVVVFVLFCYHYFLRRMFVLSVANNQFWDQLTIVLEITNWYYYSCFHKQQSDMKIILSCILQHYIV